MNYKCLLEIFRRHFFIALMIAWKLTLYLFFARMGRNKVVRIIAATFVGEESPGFIGQDAG